MFILFQVNCIHSCLIQVCKPLVSSGIKDGKRKMKCSCWILGLLWYITKIMVMPALLLDLKKTEENCHDTILLPVSILRFICQANPSVSLFECFLFFFFLTSSPQIHPRLTTICVKFCSGKKFCQSMTDCTRYHAWMPF